MSTFKITVMLTAALAFFCAIVMIPSTVQAQDLSKKEMKVLKKQLRKMSVEQYVTLRDNVTRLKNEVNEFQNKKNEFEASESQDSKKIEKLKDRLKFTRETIAEMRSQSSSVVKDEEKLDISSPNSKVGKKTKISGIIFRVQIGAFKNKELASYFSDKTNFDGQTTFDVDSYTVGSFSEYWEADSFKKLIRKMGASDVRVVVYKDGIRTSMRDVLEALRPK